MTHHSQRILEEYYTYMTMNADETLLPRFFGLYKIRIPGRPTYRIVVMNNLFQVPVGVKLKISEMYDLKGSLRNRFVTDDEKAAALEPWPHECHLRVIIVMIGALK